MESLNDRFPAAVASGDFNRDGVSDVILGLGSTAGDDGLVVAHSGADGSVLFTLSGFDGALASVGDGIPDFLVGDSSEASLFVSSISAVPEPNTILFLAFAVTVLQQSRRRKR